MAKKKFFMVGERRSGTNLLRLILNEHPKVTAPHMVAVLERMIPLQWCYGDPTVDEVFWQMIQDVVHLIHLDPIPWDGPDLQASEIFLRCHERSFIAIVDAIMALCVDFASASLWVKKEGGAMTWYTDIKRCLGDVGFIYLYRDPRDVALSYANIAHGEKHPFVLARQWLDVQELCLHCISSTPNNEVHAVCYEELVSDPCRILSDLCVFMGIEFVERILLAYQSAAARQVVQRGAQWRGLDNPVRRDSIGRYMQGMPTQEIMIVEWVAGPVMDLLGYRRMFTQSGEVHSFSEEEIARFMAENQERKAAALSKVEADRWEITRPLKRFLASIRERGS